MYSVGNGKICAQGVDHAGRVVNPRHSLLGEHECCRRMTETRRRRIPAEFLTVVASQNYSRNGRLWNGRGRKADIRRTAQFGHIRIMWYRAVNPSPDCSRVARRAALRAQRVPPY
jgi:hypothetical protein